MAGKSNPVSSPWAGSPPLVPLCHLLTECFHLWLGSFSSTLRTVSLGQPTSSLTAACTSSTLPLLPLRAVSSSCVCPLACTHANAV